MALSPQNIYFVEDGQRILILDTPYALGGEMLVYINGLLGVRDEDYKEIDPITIEFLYNLSVNDTIVTQQQTMITNSLTVINDSPKESLYKKYGKENTLLPNQRYTFTFRHGEEIYTSTFNTMLDPYYSTYDIVLMDLGTIIDFIPRDRIDMLIHDNSKLSNFIASEENATLLEEEEKTPYVYKQFVRYRTELDLIMNIYLALTGQQGRVKKVLGDLEIERENTYAGDLKDLLDDLKGKLKDWEKELRGVETKVIALGAVRGGKESYPLYNPRMEFQTPPGAGGGSSE